MNQDEYMGQYGAAAVHQTTNFTPPSLPAPIPHTLKLWTKNMVVDAYNYQCFAVNMAELYYISLLTETKTDRHNRVVLSNHNDITDVHQTNWQHWTHAADIHGERWIQYSTVMVCDQHPRVDCLETTLPAGWALNNNPIEKRNSRFVTISSLRREPSPTCTLKWPRRNRVQIMCNTESAYHVQYVPLRATWYEGTALLLSFTEFKSHLFELYFVGWTINQWRWGGNWSTRKKKP